MKTFDPTKPVQTRAGNYAKVLATNSTVMHFEFPQPIIAEFKNSAGKLAVGSFCDDGKFSTVASEYDLVNIPEPKKLRPWKPEEVPMPCVLRSTVSKTRWQVLSVSDFGIGSSDAIARNGGTVSVIEFSDVLENCEHSTDGGKTWHPCGVEE